VPPEIGSPRADAQSAFDRARRRHVISRLVSRLRREPDDVGLILPFDEVVSALGRTGERNLGLQVIGLDTIVGTVDRARGDFDRGFRPTSQRVRERWERIAELMRRGDPLPPIDVYRVGDLHFVRDGHHRVSVARALGLETIEANVTEIITRIPAGPGMRLADLALKSHERLFRERVPLPPGLQAELHLSDEWRYAALAEGVEAWGFRLMQDLGEFMTREEVARAWYERDYRPVVELLREYDLAKPGEETETYMRIVALRYMLLRTHAWDDQTVERLFDALEEPGPMSDDTLVHRLRRELGRDPARRRA
jgi:hypothetical protein